MYLKWRFGVRRCRVWGRDAGAQFTRGMHHHPTPLDEGGKERTTAVAAAFPASLFFTTELSEVLGVLKTILQEGRRDRLLSQQQQRHVFMQH